MTSNEIRTSFIQYFEKKRHTFVPSAPVVPHDDPTLMFTNAGMNQFKDIFLGTGSRPYNRAVNSQKCIRVSGKHNDLEEVGRDMYHHTFFEMLGNWSFGDYFKAEAIEWAWDLLTNVWGLPKDRLYATVFGGDAQDGLSPDEEAETLWKERTDIDPSHLSRWDKKDNFWEMGSAGPCGPCSEIHIDLTSDKSGASLVNAGRPEVIEIWNLVFIQFNRDEAGALTPLPATHVDTGMGFERICAVLQGKGSNYDTDVFKPLLAEIAALTGHTYSSRLNHDIDNAFRVIADHVRMLTFSITDQAKPSNDGRGYVLRRILRRAARFGRQQLGQKEAFLYKLVPVLVESMSEAFEELKKDPDRVADIIREEEESFGRTLDRGILLFTQAADRAKQTKIISGEDAFQLKDTFGFPFDLTVQMAEERGFSVDASDFHQREQIAKTKAREAAKKHVALAVDGELPQTDDSFKYQETVVDATVLGWIQNHALKTEGTISEADGEIGVLTDVTCLYAEQGGQVGDAGILTTSTGTFEVDTTQRIGDGIVHVGHVGDGTIEAGQPASLKVDARRDPIRRNHTATHLLHWALQKVLGEHVTQQGSLVDADRLRFDFDHHKPVTREEIERIERDVNEKIYLDLPVETVELRTADAQKLPGVRAFFGDKYGDTVRVVSIGEGFSREFCGGTHLSRTGEAGFFKIIGEEAVAKGVRRIIAVTGRAAVQHAIDTERALREVAGLLKTSPEQLPERIRTLQDEIKTLKKQLSKGAAADLRTERQKMLSEAEKIGETVIIVGQLSEAPVEQLRECMDWFRNEASSVAILIASRQDGNVMLLAAMSDDLVRKGLKAGDLIKTVAPAVDGRGGGKPQLAQAGGKNPDGIPKALQLAKEWIAENLR